MSEIALVLAGHGSHISPQTAGIVWRYVDRLRSWSVADEITACFWKEPPSFRHIFDTLLARRVVVVPVFTARGYFTKEVIPNEMGLIGAVTVKGEKSIFLTRGIGEHSKIESIVQAFVRDTLSTYNLAAEHTAVAIIGHGTRRNPESRYTARHQASRLRELDLVSEVVDVYLDDDPDIPSLYRNTSAPNVIALPYFVAPGSHVSLDVPNALGISDADTPQRANGRIVYYGDPVGVDDGICQVILALARETGLPFAENRAASLWSGFPKAGRETLLSALNSDDTLRFGQVTVSSERVWLKAVYQRTRAFESPAQLRSYLRDDPFRPLPTSTDLPAGWRVALENPEQAHAVLETVYPGLIADWSAARAGDFLTENLRDVSGRQRGMFRDIHRLDERAIERTIEQVCGKCVRQPTWRDNNRLGALPCRAACNLWLSTAVKQAEADL